MDWSSLACGARGHVTYAPDEPPVRARMSASTHAGETWRCLRCGSFVPGPPATSGPAAAAPRVRRGRELRSALILRAFAAERFARALGSAVLAYALWRFRYSRVSIAQEYNHDLLPVLRVLMTELGLNVRHSHLLGLIRHTFTLNARTLTWLALGVAGYMLIEICEGIGLWLLKRWGEYFAMIATSAGIPYEIYGLTSRITVLRVVALVINLALVLYLVLSKRLFGVRGGRHAYEARLRSESILHASEPPGPLPAAAIPPSAGSRAAPPAVSPAPRRPAAEPPAELPGMRRCPGRRPAAGQPAAAAASSSAAA
jgi:uncharacterized membrane protein (DUF2068 family)